MALSTSECARPTTLRKMARVEKPVCLPHSLNFHLTIVNRTCLRVSKIFWVHALILAVVSISLANAARAQDFDPDVANGVQALETHDGEISLDTLNIHLDIPLVDKPGVGLPFSFGLHFNNNFWVPTYVWCMTGSYCWQPNASVWGWLPDAAQGTGSFIVRPFIDNCSGGDKQYNILQYIAYQDPVGNTHLLPNDPLHPTGPSVYIAQNVSGWQGCNFASLTSSVSAFDNSGLTFNLTFPYAAEAYVGPFPAPGTGSSTVTLADGTVITPGITYVEDLEPGIQGAHPVFQLPHYISGTSIIDTNHNSILVPAQDSWPAYGIGPVGPYTFTDTLGVPELTIAPEIFAGLGAGNLFQGPSGPAGPCASSASETYTYPTGPTSTASVTLTCKEYSIKTNFGCSGYPDWPTGSGQTSWTANLIDTVTLADGSQYKFTYESQQVDTITGRLASVQYPTGNIVSYTYFTAPLGNNNPPGITYFAQGTNCNDGSVIGLTRTDDSGTWTYTRNTSAYTTIVQGPSPANNTSSYTFDSREGGAFGSALLTEEQDYQGPQTTLLRTRVFCYNGNQTNCTGATGLNYPFTQRDVYTTLPGLSKGPSRTTEKWDAFGNTTETDEYDFGATIPTHKQVASSYGYTWNGSTTSPNCGTTIGNGVNNMPCQVQLLSGSGAQLRNTYLKYGTNTNPGNLLSKASLVSGNSYLVVAFAHNSNGTISSITDENGNLTSLSYDDCNGGMPTKVTFWPVPQTTSLSEKMSWDTGCNGAVVLSVTDPNSISTSAQYQSPLWVPTSVTDEFGGTVNFTYSPTSFEAQETFNGGSSDLDVVSSTDTLGRPLLAQVIEGPGGNWDTQQSGYSWDNTGQVTTTMPPCVSATKGAGCATVHDTVTHDALNRPLVETSSAGSTISFTYTGRDVLSVAGPAPTGEVVKQVRQEFNGLGQLLSSCSLSSAPGSTSCGQDSGGTGFVTSYVYNADGTTASVSRKSNSTTQTRYFTYDGLGRTLTTSYPESGTVQYFYDVPPATPGVACSSITPPGSNTGLGCKILYLSLLLGRSKLNHFSMTL